MPASGLAASQPVSPRRKLLAACAIAGLFGTPGVWLLQVIVSEVLSASACYGVSAPRASPSWSGFDMWMFVISLVALLLAAPCAGVAWYGLMLARRVAREPDAHTHAHHHEALRTPKQLRRDDLSRVRFIALCSALVGTGFFVGVVFVWLAPWLVGPCGKWY
ncbi:hypothetical protein [Paraburkholderia strydomiana]|jgi:hypothetical protein|uniref:hypothetical protein n=1 Tax=Paraburkholderia strydomiana TaxID=1245417 RepID=UPI0038BCDF0F